MSAPEGALYGPGGPVLVIEQTIRLAAACGVVRSPGECRCAESGAPPMDSRLRAVGTGWWLHPQRVPALEQEVALKHPVYA